MQSWSWNTIFHRLIGFKHNIQTKHVPGSPTTSSHPEASSNRNRKNPNSERPNSRPQPLRTKNLNLTFGCTLEFPRHIGSLRCRLHYKMLLVVVPGWDLTRRLDPRNHRCCTPKRPWNPVHWPMWAQHRWIASQPESFELAEVPQILGRASYQRTTL